MPKKISSKTKPIPIRTQNPDSIIYRVKGRAHREDGPALEYTDGTKYWYLNGVITREDGPAIEYVDGRRDWYLKGKLHRLDGPAIVMPNGDFYYYVNGNLHREDGPAYSFSGNQRYYLNGACFSAELFNERIKHQKMISALSSLEKFSDKFKKTKDFEKAGVAVIKFLQGNCDHSFKNSKEECQLCPN